MDDFLGNGENIQDDKWTKSIAAGNRSFVEKMKSLMGGLAIGRKSIEAGESYQLREPAITYGAHLGVKKSDMAPENTYFWDVIPYNSVCWLDPTPDHIPRPQKAAAPYAGRSASGA